MKEPNLGTPVEDDIRTHFAGVLHPEKEIEIIPHTKVWATVDGVLLWDPKNGYADPYKAEGDYNPPTFPADSLSFYKQTATLEVKQALKTVVYITGPQGSGKSRLAELMADAVELNRGSFIGFTDLSRAISKQDQHQTVVITTDDLRPQAFNIDNALRIWCRERKIEYLNINLKTE